MFQKTIGEQNLDFQKEKMVDSVQNAKLDNQCLITILQ